MVQTDRRAIATDWERPIAFEDADQLLLTQKLDKFRGKPAPVCETSCVFVGEIGGPLLPMKQLGWRYLILLFWSLAHRALPLLERLGAACGTTRCEDSR